MPIDAVFGRMANELSHHAITLLSTHLPRSVCLGFNLVSLDEACPILCIAAEVIPYVAVLAPQLALHSSVLLTAAGDVIVACSVSAVELASREADATLALVNSLGAVDLAPNSKLPVLIGACALASDQS